MYELRVTGTSTITEAPALDEIVVAVVLVQVTRIGERSTATQGHVDMVGVKLIEAAVLGAKEGAAFEKRLRGAATRRDEQAIHDGLGDID